MSIGGSGPKPQKIVMPELQQFESPRKSVGVMGSSATDSQMLVRDPTTGQLQNPTGSSALPGELDSFGLGKNMQKAVALADTLANLQVRLAKVQSNRVDPAKHAKKAARQDQRIASLQQQIATGKSQQETGLLDVAQQQLASGSDLIMAQWQGRAQEAQRRLQLRTAERDAIQAKLDAGRQPGESDRHWARRQKNLNAQLVAKNSRIEFLTTASSVASGKPLDNIAKQLAEKLAAADGTGTTPFQEDPALANTMAERGRDYLRIDLTNGQTR